MISGGMMRMNSQSPFTDGSFHTVAVDTSVILNLLATGLASQILAATRRNFILVNHVVSELRYHPLDGKSLKEEIENLTRKGSVRTKVLCTAGKETFSRLVDGVLETTLDDGEAATLALAQATGEQCAVAIDEKKARRICQMQWPDTPLLSSIDFFVNLEGKDGFRDDDLGQALYDALIHTRMRVPLDRREWVVSKIGVDRAAACSSLGVATKTLSR